VLETIPHSTRHVTIIRKFIQNTKVVAHINFPLKSWRPCD